MTLLVYGAYGYTGRLVAREAVERPFDLVVAGRDRREVTHLAAARGVEGRTFAVEAAADNLDGVDAVLNCAGPFAETVDPLVDACIDAGVDYLDVTGEIEVFEAIAARDEAAADAGVTLLPGVGFDVVPTDCVAKRLAERMPDAEHLSLGFDALGSVSPGTAATAVDSLGEGGAVRRDGRIARVPTADSVREVDFGDGPRTAATIAWGDVSTAYRTTGIPNVEVYAGVPRPVAWALRAARPLEPLLALSPVRRRLRSLARAAASGPDESELESGRTLVWGEARGPSGVTVGRLETPNTYALTVESALAAAERTLAGEAPAAYATPAGAFGASFVTSLPGVEPLDW